MPATTFASKLSMAAKKSASTRLQRVGAATSEAAYIAFSGAHAALLATVWLTLRGTAITVPHPVARGRTPPAVGMSLPCWSRVAP